MRYPKLIVWFCLSFLFGKTFHSLTCNFDIYHLFFNLTIDTFFLCQHCTYCTSYIMSEWIEQTTFSFLGKEIRIIYPFFKILIYLFHSLSNSSGINIDMPKVKTTVVDLKHLEMPYLWNDVQIFIRSPICQLTYPSIYI